MTHKIALLAKTNSIVGEGPLWNHLEKKLYFVDIRGKCFWRMDWNDQTLQRVDLPQQLGCLAFAENGDLLLAMEANCALPMLRQRSKAGVSTTARSDQTGDSTWARRMTRDRVPSIACTMASLWNCLGEHIAPTVWIGRQTPAPCIMWIPLCARLRCVIFVPARRSP